MDRFIDWITNLPKALQLLFVALIVGAFGVFFYFLAFRPDNEGDVSENRSVVLLEVPGATVEDKERTWIETYRQEGLKAGTSPADYWDQLETQKGEGKPEPKGQAVGVMTEKEEVHLDPEVYSELEIYYITRGVKTKEEVDREHARLEAERRAAEEAKKREKESGDSAYLARMEQAYRMVSGQTEGTAPAAGQEPAEAKTEVQAEEKEPKTIDVSGQTRSYSDSPAVTDGIITSLEHESRGLTYSDGTVEISPVRATFLKSERVVAGQRVIMRLMEDMKLADGTRIPANTHISGICEVKGRLNIRISTVNYGGRIFRTDMSVYDNDGTEGIYCPVIEKKRGRQAAGNVAGQAASGIAGSAINLFSRNPLLGRVASTGIRELSQVTLEDGSVAINIVAGYEFYIFENIE